MDMSLSKRWEMVKDREAWHVAVHRVTKSQTWLSDWTTTIMLSDPSAPYKHWSAIQMILLCLFPSHELYSGLCSPGIWEAWDSLIWEMMYQGQRKIFRAQSDPVGHSSSPIDIEDSRLLKKKKASCRLWGSKNVTNNFQSWAVHTGKGNHHFCFGDAGWFMN